METPSVCVEGRIKKRGAIRNQVSQENQEASAQKPGGRAEGSGHVETGKLSAKRRVESTTRAQVRRRTARKPDDPTHPDSLPSCRSSLTVAAAAPEPRVPWPATAIPPSPPSMLAGAGVMTSAAALPRG